MLSPFKDYFHYSRGERRGVFLLVIFISLLLLFYFLGGFFISRQVTDFTEFKSEIAAFQESKNSDFLENDTVQYFLFNPNEIGEKEWVQLGFSEKQSASIEKYKAAGAEFKIKKDLLKLFMVDELKYAQLEPFIDLPEKIEGLDYSNKTKNFTEAKTTDSPTFIVIIRKSQVPVYSGFEGIDSLYYTKRENEYWYCILPFSSEAEAVVYQSKSDFKLAEVVQVNSLKGFYPIKQEKKELVKEKFKIEVNTADTISFSKIPGIGFGYAKRIIKYRESLGGFITISQMKETFNLPPEIIDNNLDYFEIDLEKVSKININKVEVAELKKHPYINWNIANSIVQIRNVHGKFVQVEDIKKSDLINDELFLKIAPYLSTE
jgi:DNA uptake protein ComE-like DNA-binding protein